MGIRDGVGILTPMSSIRDFMTGEIRATLTMGLVMVLAVRIKDMRMWLRPSDPAMLRSHRKIPPTHGNNPHRRDLCTEDLLPHLRHNPCNPLP